MSKVKQRVDRETRRDADCYRYVQAVALLKLAQLEKGQPGSTAGITCPIDPAKVLTRSELADAVAESERYYASHDRR